MMNCLGNIDFFLKLSGVLVLLKDDSYSVFNQLLNAPLNFSVNKLLFVRFSYLLLASFWLITKMS